MNSGANFRFAASAAVRSTFSSSAHAHLRLHFGRKSHSARHQLGDFAAAQIRRHENHRLRQIHAAVVAQRQRRLVQNSQQQLPQRVGRFLDFVKQQETDLQLLGVILRERFLRDQRMRLAVPQISRRRADQLRNFVRVLKFRAIHLDHRARIAKQHFRRRFHDARLARTGRSQEQQVPHRTSRRVQAGAKHLVQVHHGLHRFVLPHNLPPQPRFKIPRLHAAATRIQLRSDLRSHARHPRPNIGTAAERT